MKLSTIQNIFLAAVSLIAAGSLAVSVIVIVTTQDIVDARTEARIVNCEKDAKFAQAHNRLVLGIVTRNGERPVPPELQAAVDEQLVTVPDCTPEGLRKFYEGR